MFHVNPTTEALQFRSAIRSFWVMPSRGAIMGVCKASPLLPLFLSTSFDTPENRDSSSTAIMMFINVSLYDKITEAAKDLSLASIEKEFKSLGQLRQLLIDHKSLSSKEQRYPFCNHKGAKVNDSMTWEEYKGVRGSNEGSTEKAEPIFLLKQSTAGHLDDSTKDFLNNKLDTALKREKQTDADRTEIKELVSTYVAGNYTAMSSGKVSYPADMTDKEWDDVFRTNSILSGSRIIMKAVGGDDKPVSVHINRVPRAAFALKERKRVIYKVDEEGGITTTTRPSKIPDFIVADDSNVNVFETQSRLEQSLAQSAFSQTDVQASAGGGAAGFSAAVTASMSKQDQEAWKTSAKQTDQHLNISYDFPRVVLYLNKDNLELSEDCKDGLNRLKPAANEQVDTQKVIDFFETFGHFIPTRVELGGRLFSSEKLQSTDAAEVRSKSEALKVAAGVSFSSPYVQASINASHETGKDNSSGSTTSSLTKTICWEASGGDTLLCNNPPAWCASVGSHYNWRVMKQHDVIPLVKLIYDLMDDDLKSSPIHQAFEQILNPAITYETQELEATSGSNGEVDHASTEAGTQEQYAAIPIARVASLDTPLPPIPSPQPPSREVAVQVAAAPQGMTESTANEQNAATLIPRVTSLDPTSLPPVPSPQPPSREVAVQVAAAPQGMTESTANEQNAATLIPRVTSLDPTSLPPVPSPQPPSGEEAVKVAAAPQGMFESTAKFYLKLKSTSGPESYLWIDWERYWPEGNGPPQILDRPRPHDAVHALQEVADQIHEEREKYPEDYRRARNAWATKMGYDNGASYIDRWFLNHLEGEYARMGIVPKPPATTPNHLKWRFLPFKTQVSTLPTDIHKLQYNVPYELFMDGRTPVGGNYYQICASGIAPGFHQSTYLYWGYSGVNNAYFWPFSTRFVFRKAGDVNAKGAVGNKDEVHLNVITQDGKSSVGDVGKILSHSVGAKLGGYVPRCSFIVEYE
ncbi:Membrane attack complex component perforin [Cordyceps militaris]|uniref:Membrane attack complex component perforin n=1 Tax=Cordyceps militaris TaxID=73501 RepID=A0A2H4SVP1_CORMI|nr:Membrane attack complex component perforin [Cordyceps militaris]